MRINYFRIPLRHRIMPFVSGSYIIGRVCVCANASHINSRLYRDNCAETCEPRIVLFRLLGVQRYAGSFVMQMTPKFSSQRGAAPFVAAYYSVSRPDTERVTTLPRGGQFNAVHVSNISLPERCITPSLPSYDLKSPPR